MLSKESILGQLFQKSSIGRRFALTILAFSSVVTLLSTALQLSIEYKKDVSEIHLQLNEIRDGYSSSLVNSLWTTHNEDVQLQLDGIIKLPDMQYVEVDTDQNQLVASAGTDQKKWVIRQTYPLVYEYRGKQITLGHLHVVSTLEGVFQRLKSKIMVILITQGVKTFLVSLFILYLFQILVGRHLAAIAKFAGHSDDYSAEDVLTLDRIKTPSSKNDELDKVVNSINHMRNSLLASLSDIQISEENLSITLQSIGDGVIATDHEGLITRMNPVAEHLTGWTLADALGRPMKEVFDIINAQTRLPVRNPVELVMERGNIVGLANHTILLARDGNEYQIADSAAPIRDSSDEIIGVVLVFSNVTEKYYAQAQISRLSQVVNQSPFSTIISDDQGVIQYVNEQCQTMTGYFKEELIGQKMSIFTSGKHTKEFYADLWDTVSVQKKMWRGIIINKRKNDQNMDCYSSIFPLFDGDHNVVSFVTIQEDITEQNIKDKLFLMQTRQAQMGEMLSMIAHQWRQPLAVISSLMNKQRIDLALGNHTVDGLVQSITDVDVQVQYLSRTISDFRDFFKPDKEKTPTTTADIFAKALGLIGHTLKNENIQVIQTHQHDEPYAIYEHEMVQVILNLFKNAQDVFNERKISNPEIIITSNQNNNQCIITVDDNAGGVDVSVIDTIFLPYVSTKTQQNGTGLGLYMSKTIIEEHCHGSLRVENTQNGAKFTMIFPIKDFDGTL